METFGKSRYWNQISTQEELSPLEYFALDTPFPNETLP